MLCIIFYQSNGIPDRIQPDLIFYSFCHIYMKNIGKAQTVNY